MSETNLIGFIVRLSPSEHKQLKIILAHRGKTIRQWVRDKLTEEWQDQKKETPAA